MLGLLRVRLSDISVVLKISTNNSYCIRRFTGDFCPIRYCKRARKILYFEYNIFRRKTMNRLVTYKTTANILLNDGITPAMSGFRLLIFTVNGILFDGEAVSKSLKNAVSKLGLDSDKAYRAVRSCAEAFSRKSGSAVLSVRAFISALSERVAKSCYRADFSHEEDAASGYFPGTLF